MLTTYGIKHNEYWGNIQILANNLINMNKKNRFGFALLFGATLLMSSIFIINLLRSYIETDGLSWLFYIPAALGHAALFTFILYLIFFIPFAFAFKNLKIPVVIFLTMAIFCQIILIIDGLVFNLYRFHINGFVLEMVFNGGNEIFVFDVKLYLKFGLLILVAVVIPYSLILWLAKRYSLLSRKKTTLIICCVLVLCMLFSHISHAVASAVRQTGIQRAGTVLPYYFPLTMNGLLKKMGVVYKEEIDVLACHNSASDIAYPVHPVVIGDSAKNYNILFIAIDSWNPCSFDSITMPYLYNFASQNQYFTNHLSSSNGTRGSIFGFFYGLSYTYETDFIATKTTPVLIDILLKQNYDIQVFPGGPLQGNPFETIFKKTPHVHSKTSGKTALERDKTITQMAMDFIGGQKRENPFFTFVFYDLPHSISLPKEYLKFQPSWTEANYLALNNNTDPVPFFNLYRSCVYQTDQQIKILLEYVQNSGLMDNTIVIITGDHGQEFNENGKNYWGHGSNFSQWQIHVPLIVWIPNMKRGERFSHITTHYDMVPSLMKNCFAVQNPVSDYGMGYEFCDTTSRYPHIVGDHVNYGFVFENTIVTTRHLGDMLVTDKAMNNLPRSAISINELKKAIEKKNMFYKKP